MPTIAKQKATRKKTAAFADHKSEFITELSALISKWRGLPGKEALVYASAYENVLYGLLTPEQTNEP